MVAKLTDGKWYKTETTTVSTYSTVPVSICRLQCALNKPVKFI